MATRKQLATVGFGVPNLLKTGSVGYFPEEFIKDFDLQGMTALEIKEELLRSEIDIDSDVIGCWRDGIGVYDLMYYVNLLDNVFIKYGMDGSEHPMSLQRLLNSLQNLDLLIEYSEDFM